MFGTVWNGRGASLAGAAVFICGLSESALAAGPKEVPGPGAELECFAPWTADTKYFQ